MKLWTAVAFVCLMLAGCGSGGFKTSEPTGVAPTVPAPPTVMAQATMTTRPAGAGFQQATNTALAATVTVSNPGQIPTGVDGFAYKQAMRLGRGVNLGNALEAPKEGDWGIVLKEDYFLKIKAAGFQAVRVPIRWTTHALATAPYTIEPEFLARVDWVVAQALKNDLAVVINDHHHDEMFANSGKENERFLAIWTQIAEHFKAASDLLMFEPLNEPNGAVSPDLWNGIAQEALQVVRASNPGRTVVIGPGNWNALSSLNELKLPENDRNIIVTFHYYSPFQFTHQGAEWVNGSNAWLGTPWDAEEYQKNAVKDDLDLAAAWGKKNMRPLFLGEFGAYSKAAANYRHLWTDFVARTAESRGMSWAYWEFCAGFGVYDPNAEKWNEPILSALMPR